MAEAIGLIASVIQVAGAGLKLSQTLYQYADGVATADRRIKDIAKEIQLTSFVIEELGDVFKHDETSTLMSKNAVKTANETMMECSSVFAEIDATLKKSKKNTLGRLMLPFRDNKIELLRNHIDKLKSTLQLLMQVLTHAHQVATKKLDREAEAKQKAQIQELIELKKKSTKKYEESLRNVSLSDGSTIIDPDGAASDQEDIGDGPVGDFTMAAAAIGSTITPKTLATCVQHIRSLLEDIETLQQALATKVEGDDHSEHHQSLIGSYFRARGHLDGVLFSGSQARNMRPGRAPWDPSLISAKSIEAQVNMRRVTTDSTLNEGLSTQVTLVEPPSDPPSGLIQSPVIAPQSGSSIPPPMATPCSRPIMRTLPLDNGGGPKLPTLAHPSSVATLKLPPRLITGVNNPTSIDDLIGAPQARKGPGAKKKEAGRYVDVINSEPANTPQASRNLVAEADEWCANREATRQEAFIKARENEDTKELRKSPIKFHDTLGRMYSLPFHTCKTWERMQKRIERIYNGQDFGTHQVAEGHFDILDSNGYTILDEDWEDTIEPGMSLTMRFSTKNIHTDVPKTSTTGFMDTESISSWEPVASGYKKGEGVVMTTSNVFLPSVESSSTEEELYSFHKRHRHSDSRKTIDGLESPRRQTINSPVSQGDHSTEKEKAYSGDASELVKLIEENTKQVRFESYRANSRVEDRIRVAKREKERAEARENQVQQTGNDVSSMEEKMPNTSLLAVAQARQQNPRKLHERGYGQHFPAVAAAAKRQMKTKKSFDFSLEGAALLGRRGKKLEPDASLPSPSVSTGYEAAGEGDVQPNTQDYQKQAENKQGTLEPPFLTSHRSSLMGALHEGESEVTLQDLAAGKLTRQSNHGSSSKPTSGQRTEIVSVHSRSASISQLRPPPVNTERAPGAIFGRARTQAPPPVSFPSIFNTSPKSARDSAADLENPFATSASALPVSSDPWDARNQPKNSMSTTSNHEAGTHSRNDTIPLDTGHKTLQATFFARLTRDTQVGPGAIRRGNITPLSVKDEGYTASHQDIGEGNNTRRSSLPNTVFKPSSGKGTEIDIEAKEFRRKNVKALGIHEPAPTTAPTTVDHNAIRTLQDIMKARREREEQNRRKAEQEHMKNAERRARPAGLGGHTPSSSQKATQAAQLRYNETRRPDSSVYQPLYMVERLRSSSSSPLLPELPNGISLGEWGPSDDEAGAFQSTVVRAFDEGGSSDSDASFIYDSALPLDQIPYRCRKSDARTPSMTSLSSLTKPPSVIEDTHDNPGKSSSIEFACSSIPVGDRELTERCKGTLPIGTGQFRQSSHHHHIVGKQEDVSVNVDEDEVDALLKDWTTVF